MEKNVQDISIRNISADATEEELTAIIAALNLYYHGGCEEKKITIKNNYSSNWNSKMFGINQLTK